MDNGLLPCTEWSNILDMCWWRRLEISVQEGVNACYPQFVFSSSIYFLLTLSKVTKFRPETAIVCQQPFQIRWKWQKVLLKGRKHYGKTRNSSIRARSPFPTVLSKDLYYRHLKTRLIWERVKAKSILCLICCLQLVIIWTRLERSFL